MQIAVDSVDDTEVNSLYEWLSSDDDVRAGAKLTLAASGDRTGAQSPWDVINVVLSNGTALANLLIAYATWKGTRPTRPSLTLTVNGVEIKVHEADEATIQRVVRAAAGDDAGPAVTDGTSTE